MPLVSSVMARPTRASHRRASVSRPTGSRSRRADNTPAAYVARASSSVGATTTSASSGSATPGRPTSSSTLLSADGCAIAAAVTAVALDPALAAGAAAVATVIVFQRATAHQALPAKVIGIRQSVLGLAVVIATTAGIHLT